jgi:hypothetical protein
MNMILMKLIKNEYDLHHHGCLMRHEDDDVHFDIILLAHISGQSSPLQFFIQLSYLSR